MDYLELLPQNIHEEISQQINKDEPYSEVEISKREKGNYLHGNEINISIILLKKQNIPENIKKIFENYNKFTYRKPDIKKRRTINFNKIFYDPSKNIFIGINENHGNIYAEMLFSGDNKLYQIDKGDYNVSYLSKDVNYKLFNSLIELIKCDICDKNMDITFITNDVNNINKIKVNNYKILEKKCNDCSNVIIVVHEECEIKCFGCQKNICQTCYKRNKCNLCNNISCYRCSCVKKCEKCNKNICTKNKTSYVEKLPEEPIIGRFNVKKYVCIECHNKPTWIKRIANKYL